MLVNPGSWQYSFTVTQRERHRRGPRRRDGTSTDSPDGVYSSLYLQSEAKRRRREATDFTRTAERQRFHEAEAGLAGVAGDERGIFGTRADSVVRLPWAQREIEVRQRMTGRAADPSTNAADNSPLLGAISPAVRARRCRRTRTGCSARCSAPATLASSRRGTKGVFTGGKRRIRTGAFRGDGPVARGRVVDRVVKTRGRELRRRRRQGGAHVVGDGEIAVCRAEDAGQRRGRESALRQAASAASSATATVSGARRRSLGGSSSGAGRPAAVDGPAARPARISRARAQPGRRGAHSAAPFTYRRCGLANSVHALAAPNSSTQLLPPNPNELLIACRTARLGVREPDLRATGRVEARVLSCPA